MTEEQMHWARCHDWYVSKVCNGYDDYAVAVRCADGEKPDYMHCDYRHDPMSPGVKLIPVRVFTDARALRAWAGY